MTEKFNLKWNDFESNASQSYKRFRNETYLHDVTLVSDDFKQVPAHKLVLSASSEYFKSVLQQTKQSQPILCLNGLNQTDLMYILDYVYDGEVKILQEELDRFLEIAQRFKINGLMNGEEEKYEEPLPEFKHEKTVDEENLVDMSKVPSTKQSTPREYNQIVKVNYNFDGNTSSKDHDAKLDEMIVNNEDGTISCSNCGKIGTKARSAAHTRFNLKSSKVHIRWRAERITIFL